jgi:hypothetical protein
MGNVMGGMKDLLGDTPYVPRNAHQLVRKSDPVTSWEAAASIVPNLRELQRVVYYVIGEAGSRGLTDLELDARCIAKNGKRGYSTYRTRRAELVSKGLVIDTGRTREQEGSKRTVWALAVWGAA